MNWAPLHEGEDERRVGRIGAGVGMGVPPTTVGSPARPRPPLERIALVAIASEHGSASREPERAARAARRTVGGAARPRIVQPSARAAELQPRQHAGRAQPGPVEGRGCRSRPRRRRCGPRGRRAWRTARPTAPPPSGSHSTSTTGSTATGVVLPCHRYDPATAPERIGERRDPISVRRGVEPVMTTRSTTCRPRPHPPRPPSPRRSARARQRVGRRQHPRRRAGRRSCHRHVERGDRRRASASPTTTAWTSRSSST